MDRSLNGQMGQQGEHQRQHQGPEIGAGRGDDRKAKHLRVVRGGGQDTQAVSHRHADYRAD